MKHKLRTKKKQQRKNRKSRIRKHHVGGMVEVRPGHEIRPGHEVRPEPKPEPKPEREIKFNKINSISKSNSNSRAVVSARNLGYEIPEFGRRESVSNLGYFTGEPNIRNMASKEMLNSNGEQYMKNPDPNDPAKFLYIRDGSVVLEGNLPESSSKVNVKVNENAVKAAHEAAERKRAEIERKRAERIERMFEPNPDSAIEKYHTIQTLDKLLKTGALNNLNNDQLAYLKKRIFGEFENVYEDMGSIPSLNSKLAQKPRRLSETSENSANLNDPKFIQLLKDLGLKKPGVLRRASTTIAKAVKKLGNVDMAEVGTTAAGVVKYVTGLQAAKEGFSEMMTRVSESLDNIMRSSNTKPVPFGRQQSLSNTERTANLSRTASRASTANLSRTASTASTASNSERSSGISSLVSGKLNKLNKLNELDEESSSNSNSSNSRNFKTPPQRSMRVSNV